MENVEPIKLTDHIISHKDIETDALQVLSRLHDYGFYAYLVGGSVRDLLLQRTPKDFDVVTSAQPDEIRRLFRRCRLVGRRFRLAHVIGRRGKVIETATFRAKPEDDREALLITDDNRFGTPQSDAYRRDFTVNALFYDSGRNEVLDYVGGLEDLDARILRTIGDPVTRFREDPVRILRAIKFAARLDFTLEEETRKAITSERTELAKAAIPRIYEELVRMLGGGAAERSLQLLNELRVLEVLAPEIAAVCSLYPEPEHCVLHRFMHCLDDQFHQIQGKMPNGLILTALFWPVYQAISSELPRAPRPDEQRILISELMRPMALRLAVPRRSMEMAISTIEGHLRFKRINGRRSGRVGFARTPNYPMAAVFATMRREVGDMSTNENAAWEQQLEEFPPPPLEQPKPRRRRRGPRRRR